MKEVPLAIALMALGSTAIAQSADEKAVKEECRTITIETPQTGEIDTGFTEIRYDYPKGIIEAVACDGAVVKFETLDFVRAFLDRFTGMQYPLMQKGQRQKGGSAEKEIDPRGLGMTAHTQQK